MSRPDRVAGGLVGLLVGDALGVPYEFHPPDRLPPREHLEPTPPDGFPRAHPSVPVGTWSDDGAQALCLLESLLERDELDLEDFGGRLVRWWEQGHLAVDGHVYDVGTQTHRALRRIRSGTAPDQAGGRDEAENGNGSLMRVLPLALWHAGDDASLVRDAERQSLPTHGHLRSQVCCALYVLWARAELQEREDGYAHAVQTLTALYRHDPSRSGELDLVLSYRGASGSGYVVDCLHSARVALRSRSYEEAVRAAVALGNDTDTTACVVGGIAGIRFGYAGIPSRWREALRGGELYAPLLRALLARTTAD